MSIDIDKFDFGFTVVDEDELEVVQKQTQKLESASGKAEEVEEKLNNRIDKLNFFWKKNKLLRKEKKILNINTPLAKLLAIIFVPITRFF